MQRRFENAAPQKEGSHTKAAAWLGALAVIVAVFTFLVPREQFLDLVKSTFSAPKSTQASRTECDDLAGFRWDTSLPAGVTGRDFRDIPIAAQRACEDAVTSFPDTPRLNAQLGRTRLKNNDYVGAISAYKRALELGHVVAANELASIYTEGLGAPANYFEAARLLQSAAEAGYPLSMNNLGVAYANGTGVPKNASEARKWLNKAASAGVFVAQENQRELDGNGDGVLKRITNEELAVYCAKDYIHNGNILNGFNQSGLARTGKTRGLLVTEISSGKNSQTIPTRGAAAVKGKFGRLYMFSNGSFTYYSFSPGENVDQFNFIVLDADETNIPVTLKVVGTTWFKNKSIITVNGATKGTNGSDAMVAYTAFADDTLSAEGGDDSLFAWSGTDTLMGGDGNDVLIGEYGPDLLWGGRGADVFVTSREDLDGGVKGTFFDTINDFNSSEGDLIDLSPLIDDRENARNSPTAYVRAKLTQEGALIQVNNQKGKGWQDGIFVKAMRSFDVGELLRSGSISF